MTDKLKLVLLVDDDETTNYLHKRVLDRSGLVDEVAVATDGVEALALLTGSGDDGAISPDLIFLDINMPGMDGFEFLDTYSTLAIEFRAARLLIMLTTSLLEADHDKARSYEIVDDIINKPLTVQLMEELLAA